MARVPLSSTEFNILIENFGIQNGTRVNYRQLLDIVEENAELKVLVKENAVLRSFGNMVKYGKQPMTREENLLCEEVIRRFKTFV
jgi:hypothetical protein